MYAIGWDEAWEDYHKELDMYCDTMEKMVDKLSNKLAFTSNEKVINELGSFKLGEINRTQLEWKKWSMEDDE